MAKSRGRALVIDADPAIRRGLSRALAERDIEPLTAEDGASGLLLLRAQAVDAALIDVAPGRAGIEAAESIARDHPEVSLVLVVPPASAESAVEAAWTLSADVLHKPIEPLSLGALFAARAIARGRAGREARALSERAEEEALGELSGTSAGARAAVRLAGEAAATRAPVLISGEDGSGRDRLARLIHDRGRRSGRPFISFSCASLEADPEGERLFGAATNGAPRERLLDVAERGTLFLDAVEALPIAAQDRLLRLLSRGEVVGPGGAASSADVRVLAGSAGDLRRSVRAGAFREELFYRLSALEIVLPPLRDRLEDLPLLAYAFLRSLREETGREVRRISPEALRLLRHHEWPGNARELRSVLAHAVALARSDVIFPSDLPFAPKVSGDPPDELFDDELSEVAYAEARRRALSAFERRYTRLVLARESGNLSGAARRAGMDRSNFKRLLRRAKAPLR